MQGEQCKNSTTDLRAVLTISFAAFPATPREPVGEETCRQISCQEGSTERHYL